ncbi:enoyl-CoA hydratase/isomerase family protein [Cocleimonas sp. KMM 6892]|uniref:enoyl-CoA hydratase/isomerase family protein n=1 Tax=unclassified Cocleimonas TaxID=2639732 RepID=UPI002DB7D206|nr:MULTISPECIES: enoyl-CoA hydratase/isomerase family protein [unclassified Cocleimonas]MEB8432602.1 enoyl-CoA hydratase/isomerase family protein [Cocleimonas sp. KMM 6892]MEC4715461.1 enoyl-CoA hydratase/isomerase family protein [Cocleimonas sp. KMM 6895]MEC4744921.1 enoyl-CoA hydratase/isomerase family protein [Cocleimonas sp. KMM 6896]
MIKRIDFTENMHAEILDNGVAELIFGPENQMPMTDAKGHEVLGVVWGALAAEKEVRCILVRSLGKGFCAGGTPELVESMLNDGSARLRVMQEGRALVQGMIECDLPIVSAINGAAVGAGAAVALLADVSIAGERAKIIDGHTKIGVAAGDHAAIIWPLLCGMAKAKYHLLMCSAINGTEAERIGLVSLVVPDDELLEKSREVAHTLAQSSPNAITFTKRSLNHWLRAAWPAFEHSLALEILGFEHADAHEGMAAAKERRTAEFSKR